MQQTCIINASQTESVADHWRVMPMNGLYKCICFCQFNRQHI